MAKKPIFVVDEQVIPDCLTDFLSREDFRAKGAETIRRTSAELEGSDYWSIQLCLNGVFDWLKKATLGTGALQKKAVRFSHGLSIYKLNFRFMPCVF